MKITVTIQHALTFTVEAFWNEEGGMGSDVFGTSCAELPEAIALLQTAKANGEIPDGVEWVIVARVTTITK